MSRTTYNFMTKEEHFHKYLFSGAIGRIWQGLKNEFESAMVNEPSVFELLRFDCRNIAYQQQRFSSTEVQAVLLRHQLPVLMY